MGRLQSGINDLYTWCLNNGERGQQLIDEWVGEDEEGNIVEMSEVSKGTPRKVKWRCIKCGYEWDASIVNRTAKNPTGCPICNSNHHGKAKRSKLIVGENDLLTWCKNNGEYGRLLIQQWVGEDVDGNQIKMKDYTYGSSEIVKWKCLQCRNIWSREISGRTTKSRIGHIGCDKCGRKQAGETYRETILKGKRNDLLSYCNNNGIYGQQLQEEYTGIRDNGEYIPIDKISESSGMIMKWTCKKCKKDFQQSVLNRTKYGFGCTDCNKSGTSYGEQFIYWGLYQIYKDAENRCKVLKDKYPPHGIEYDIAIPSIPLCIEYSGTYWHSSRVEMDELKVKLCKMNNIEFIRIYQNSLDISIDINGNLVKTSMYKEQSRDNALGVILDHILKHLGHSIQEIDVNEVQEKAYKQSKRSIKFEESLAFTHPKLVKLWNFTKNIHISPEDVTHGSREEVYWECPNCHHGHEGEWTRSIGKMVNDKNVCPNCSYSWYFEKVLDATRNRKNGQKIKEDELLSDYIKANRHITNEMIIKYQVSRRALKRKLQHMGEFVIKHKKGYPDMEW